MVTEARPSGSGGLFNLRIPPLPDGRASVLTVYPVFNRSNTAKLEIKREFGKYFQVHVFSLSYKFVNKEFEKQINYSLYFRFAKHFIHHVGKLVKTFSPDDPVRR